MRCSPAWLSILIALGIATARAVTAAPTESHNQPDQVVSRIPRDPVPSSAIAAVGYSKRRQILEIEFLNGAIYRYTGVPRSVHQKLMTAPSKTHYYLEFIKGNYPSLRIRKWHPREARN